jgi:hypothetical protein
MRTLHTQQERHAGVLRRVLERIEEAHASCVDQRAGTVPAGMIDGAPPAVYVNFPCIKQAPPLGPNCSMPYVNWEYVVVPVTAAGPGYARRAEQHQQGHSSDQPSGPQLVCMAHRC